MSNRPPGTGGRALLRRLSQSPVPRKCSSHLGFSLGPCHLPSFQYIEQWTGDCFRQVAGHCIAYLSGNI